jgi:hypothetical protein
VHRRGTTLRVTAVELTVESCVTGVCLVGTAAHPPRWLGCRLIAEPPLRLDRGGSPAAAVELIATGNRSQTGCSPARNDRAKWHFVQVCVNMSKQRWAARARPASERAAPESHCGGAGDLSSRAPATPDTEPRRVRSEAEETARVRRSSGSANAGAELVVGPGGQPPAWLESSGYPPTWATSCIRVDPPSTRI